MFRATQAKIRPLRLIEKASPQLQWKILHNVADALMPVMRAGLGKGFEAMQAHVNLYEIVDAIETGRTHLINAQIIDWEKIDVDLRDQLKDGISKGIIRGGKVEKAFFVEAVRRIIPEITQVEIPFTLDNPRVASWINRRIDLLATKMDAEGVQAVQNVTAMFYNKGFPPREAAKAIRGSIGLNHMQARALANYRINLLKDPNIGARNIDKLVGQYESRAIKYRAEMIARTESITSVMRGQQAVWEQAADAGFIQENEVSKEWIVTPDDALCEYCQEMDRQRVPMRELFTSESLGVSVDSPTLHPNCRCVMRLIYEK